MTSPEDRVCAGCGDTEEVAQLEKCPMCRNWFCPDCVFRQTGRRFCSAECAKAYFYGDIDDLEDDFEPDELNDNDD